MSPPLCGGRHSAITLFILGALRKAGSVIKTMALWQNEGSSPALRGRVIKTVMLWQNEGSSPAKRGSCLLPLNPFSIQPVGIAHRHNVHDHDADKHEYFHIQKSQDDNYDAADGPHKAAHAMCTVPVLLGC